MTGSSGDYGFRIVHQVLFSPEASATGCHQTDPRATSGSYLDQYVGADGLTRLLALADTELWDDTCFSGLRVRDTGGWLDLIRRMQTPYYEEARQYFELAEAEDFDVWICSDKSEAYLPETLKAVIAEYEPLPACWMALV